MLLKVTHETRYAYTPPVETAQHLAHLRPRETGHQRVLAHALDIRPEPAQRSESIDAFGNARAFFALDATHDALAVVAESLVDTAPPEWACENAAGIAWEEARERFRYAKGAAFDPACEFIFPSRYVPRLEPFAAYVRPSFTDRRDLREALMDLTLRMRREFRYDADSTEISTPAEEALASRRGVCQDFAHIMIACLRTLGLPARYVSGYLLTHPPEGEPRLVGADASHAWVSAYLPDPREGRPGRWVEFDPTNGRQPGEDYVTLAYGRDYSDVSPMRGVLHGGARHTLRVGVTVEPVEALEVAIGSADPASDPSTPGISEP